jgi:hypothetical protein
MLDSLERSRIQFGFASEYQKETKKQCQWFTTIVLAGFEPGVDVMTFKLYSLEKLKKNCEFLLLVLLRI